MRNEKITPLYERLSRDDELQGESNSISNHSVRHSGFSVLGDDKISSVCQHDRLLFPKIQHRYSNGTTSISISFADSTMGMFIVREYDVQQ